MISLRSGYNVRRLLTTIAESSAYQLSSRFTEEWQPEYTSYFARKFVRRLWAEEVHDAIVMATGVPTSYGVGQLPTVQWAMQLPEASPEPRSNGAVNTFLNLFLRGNRDQNARSGEATILQALNMMNNTFVTSRLRNATAGSTVNRLLADRDYSDSRRGGRTLSVSPEPVSDCRGAHNRNGRVESESSSRGREPDVGSAQQDRLSL